MKPYLTTQRLLEKFLLLYTELHNTTRMPENYGHTPEELFESERIRRVVGRNDPCPCGSGKKYKKSAAEGTTPPSDDVSACPPFRNIRRRRAWILPGT